MNKFKIIFKQYQDSRIVCSTFVLPQKQKMKTKRLFNECDTIVCLSKLDTHSRVNCVDITVYFLYYLLEVFCSFWSKWNCNNVRSIWNLWPMLLFLYRSIFSSSSSSRFIEGDHWIPSTCTYYHLILLSFMLEQTICGQHQYAETIKENRPWTPKRYMNGADQWCWIREEEEEENNRVPGNDILTIYINKHTGTIWQCEEDRVFVS